MKKVVHERYYGNEKKPKNPFSNCKTPAEVFNLSRRIANETNLTLKRFGVVCSNDGDVLLKGEKHKIFNVEELIERDKITKDKNLIRYGRTEDKSESKDVAVNKGDASGLEKHYKRDYFLPLIDMLSAVSNQFLQHEGIPLEVLGGMKIYCRKGVWPPTQDKLYSFFKAYLQERAHFIKEQKGVLDIGTGTGILSFILQKFLDKDEVIHAVDLNDEAIKTASMNRSILNCEQNIKTHNFDIRMMSKFSDSQLDLFLKKEK
mgnify:CR=1 FL=1